VSVNEHAVCNPKNEYERTKLESETLLVDAHNKYGFQLDILRPTNVYGEYHPFNALLNLINHKISNKPLISTPEALVNYVYVKDLTAVILFSLNETAGFGIVNVGESDSLKHFSSILSSSLNKKDHQIIVPRFLINFIITLGIHRFNAVSNQVAYSDQKLKTFFRYPYGLQKGLDRTVAYYKQKELI